MKFEIKSRWNGSVLFSLETDSLKLCVEAAVEAKTYLNGADLRGADLRGAYLIGAYLSGADLIGADLIGADLIGADLNGAYLSGAYLSGADLRGADLLGADLNGADLSGAYLRGAVNGDLAIAKTSIVPESGGFQGWKKCKDGVLVRVRIPAKAKRSSATGRKCRAEYVLVMEVIGAEVGISQHDGKTEYRKGEIVKCDTWNEDRFIECGGGIHFYLTRIEAENH